MKKSVFVGLFFVCFSLIFPLYMTVRNVTYPIRVDLIPTFLGFLLIAAGLDNLPYANRRLTDAGRLAAGLSLVSFVTLISQFSPIFTRASAQTPVGSGWRVLAAGLSAVRGFYAVCEHAFTAIYMVFVAYLTFSIAGEIQRRTATADRSFNGQKKDAYGDPVFSGGLLDRFALLSRAMGFVYAGIAVLYAANFIFALIQWKTTGKALGLSISFFDFEFGLWAFLIPVHVLYLCYANTAVNICAQTRRETRISGED